MTTYGIDDAYGNAITVGLSSHEAEKVAQRIADERGETVYLYQMGTDDLVEGPLGSGRCHAQNVTHGSVSCKLEPVESSQLGEPHLDREANRGASSRGGDAR